MCLNETHSKVCIGQYLADGFPIQNILKQADASQSPLVCESFSIKDRGRIQNCSACTVMMWSFMLELACSHTQRAISHYLKDKFLYA
jgi:hypothetical protein